MSKTNPLEQYVKELNQAVAPLNVVFGKVSENCYKAGDNPISGTEIYIVATDDQTLKACRSDKKLFRAQPVGKGVVNSINQYSLDLSRNQPTVEVGVVKVMQTSLIDTLTQLSMKWGLIEWFTTIERPGFRFVCSDADQNKFIIDYRPERPKKMMAVMTGRV